MKKSEKINVENLLGMGFRQAGTIYHLYFIQLGEYKGLYNSFTLYFHSSVKEFRLNNLVLTFSKISEIKKFISHFK